jgi:transposase-like protein
VSYFIYTTSTLTLDLDKYHRFPAERIRYCVWLYYRFSLRYDDVEERMADRDVTLSHTKPCDTSVGSLARALSTCRELSQCGILAA